MQTATGVLFLNLFFFILGAKGKQGAGRQGRIRKVICYIPTPSQQQTFGTRCSVHIKTYNPFYWSTLLCETYTWGCREKKPTKKYTKHLLLAFALQLNFRSCADYKKIKLSLIISDQQKAVKSQNGKKKPTWLSFMNPKLGWWVPGKAGISEYHPS